MRAEPTSTRLALVQERGIALIAALMIMLLMSALMIGFTAVVMSDQRYRGIDKDRTRAYYGAQSGLEKLSTDLGNLFLTNVAPTDVQVAALGNNPPTIPGVTFVAPAGVTAYGAAPSLIPCADDSGTITLVVTCSDQISTGPYQGLMALKKKYDLNAVARTTSGGEAHLMRSIESVAIPVFQFGMFSDVDLAFFAGPNFNFGGRVHTNGNLFLAQGGGAALTLTDKVTAVGDVIRARMQNGVLIGNSPTHDGNISLATAPNAFRNLLASEGSLTDGLGSSTNPQWHTISIGTYNGYIRNGGCPTPATCPTPARGTGAKPLNLALITVGGTNTDLTRRPQMNEDTTNSVLFGERMFAKKEGMSLRILLSDQPTNMTRLPTVTATAPIPLGEVAGVAPDWKTAVPAGLTAVGPNNPPIARSPQAMPVPPAANPFVINAATVAGQTTVPFTYSALTFPTTLHRPTYPMAVGANSVTCTSVNATQFTNCVPVANWVAVANGAALAPYTVNGVTYTPTINGSIGAAGNKNAKNILLNSTANPGPYTAALPYGLNTFWMQDNNNTLFAGGNAAYANYPTLVTCTGFDSTALGVLTNFNGCTGVPSSTNGKPILNHVLHAANTGLVGGYIKIEIQKADFTWQDVTAEILNYGIAGPSQNNAGVVCTNAANSKAIIHLQRLKDTPGGCTTGGSQDSYDYWPNVLFDAREGLLRDNDPNDGHPTLGGLMHYIEIDVKNLSLWFKCAAPYNVGVCSGNQVLTNNGYGVYFSDRRNNVNPGPFSNPNNPANVDGANLESGEYGFEDFVNPLSATGTPNGTLDGGEDVNANTLLDTYGQLPSSAGVSNALPAGGLAAVCQTACTAGYDLPANVRPSKTLNNAQAMVNRTYLFRRALKLVNGSLGNIVTPGFTVVTENPVYIQGDWNANQASTLASYGDPHAETAVIADAVTLLSNNWNDVDSFVNPYDPGNTNGGDRTRGAAPSWYRLAIIAGKGMAFPWPSAGTPANDFGTDGGAHNFLRYLESGGTVNYQGAIATFYYNRQAVGTYKCCNTVYGAPTRNYNFDTDFLNPATLPPLTPVFRDINALGFSQEIRPGK